MTVAESLAFMFCFVGVLSFYWFWAVIILMDWAGYLPPLEDDPPTPPENRD